MDSILPGNSNHQALIEELEELYPLYTPSPKDADRMIMYRAGQRSVVDYIISKLS